jgi:adenylate cyclase, class 2
VTATLEREIKLRFDSADQAREAVRAAGGTPMRARRLQEDCLLDTPDGMLQRRRSLLRVRMECGKSLLTFKGPALPSTMKLREEIETVGGDGSLLLSILEQLGFHVWFRYEKYREEFALDDVLVAVDETPVGVFVELEGGERGITATAGALGRGPSDYLLESYRSLFLKYCEERGVPATDMLFASD